MKMTALEILKARKEKDRIIDRLKHLGVNDECVHDYFNLLDNEEDRKNWMEYFEKGLHLR